MAAAEKSHPPMRRESASAGALAAMRRSGTARNASVIPSAARSFAAMFDARSPGDSVSDRVHARRTRSRVGSSASVAMSATKMSGMSAERSVAARAKNPASRRRDRGDEHHGAQHDRERDFAERAAEESGAAPRGGTQHAHRSSKRRSESSAHAGARASGASLQLRRIEAIEGEPREERALGGRRALR